MAYKVLQVLMNLIIFPFIVYRGELRDASVDCRSIFVYEDIGRYSPHFAIEVAIENEFS